MRLVALMILVNGDTGTTDSHRTEQDRKETSRKTDNKPYTAAAAGWTLCIISNAITIR